MCNPAENIVAASRETPAAVFPFDRTAMLHGVLKDSTRIRCVSRPARTACASTRRRPELRIEGIVAKRSDFAVPARSHVGLGED